jgi:tetratricopeptide (TPR) repeat protein
LGAVTLALAMPANAAWQQASSKHFVIYGDMPAEEMQAYATKLETFDAAARLIRRMKDPTVGDGNRVHVYVVPTDLDVNRTLGTAAGDVLGYYVDDVRSPYIVTPLKVRRDRDDRQFSPETVFFHEYTHHLQLQSTNRPMPAWLSEGFAEFLSSPIFGADGSISLGTPAVMRAEQLLKYPWAPLDDLLAGNAITLGYSGFWHQNYAQGWLLNHYLAFEPSRKGQIEDFVRRISAGEGSLNAAKGAFGDIGKLDSELREYRRTKQFAYLKIDATKLDVPKVTVSPLTPAASEIMMLRIYAKTGYNALNKGAVLKRVREIATKSPGDPIVMRTLAQVEYDSENYDAAGVAADAAMKADPTSNEAMLFKGRSLLGKGWKSNDPAMFKEARNWFMKANKVDPEDPEPLYLYFRSYRDANAPVPQSALDALKYAAVLTPRDWKLQVRLGVEYLRQNRLAEARTALEPVAFQPHGVAEPKYAKQALDLIASNNIQGAIALLEKEVIFEDGEDVA